MSNLVTFSTINERVKKYKEDYNLESSSLAFLWLSLESILGLNENEIDDSITEGSMDGGIDAIFIDDKEVHFFNCKYTEKFRKINNNFPEGEIDKIIVTLDRIFKKKISKRDVNDILWDKIKEIWDLLKQSPLNFKFYLCSNMKKPTDHAIQKFESTLNQYKYVNYYYFDHEEIVTKILEKKYKKIDGEIRFVDLQYFDRSDGPLKGIVATVSAIDLINLVIDRRNPEKLNENAFNDNIRIYLKLKNRINRSIYKTALSDENYIFWYLNNGVTILCDECIYTPNTRSPKVKLKNFQIVNGGQTTHALYEAYLKDYEKLKNVLVLVRICETKRASMIGEKISETTNSQTPICSRDLHANDRIQKQLEEQFRDLGYFYERKKNQYQDKPKEKRLDNELLAQIYLAYYLDMPSQAKNQKRIVFGEKYDEIFDEEKINAEEMLKPYLVFVPLERMKREIQKKKRKKEEVDEKEAFISRAIFHLLNVVKLIEENEQIDLSNERDIDYAIKKAINFVSEVVEREMKNRGELYTHDKFFKEISTNKIIRNHVLDKYKTR